MASESKSGDIIATVLIVGAAFFAFWWFMGMRKPGQRTIATAGGSSTATGSAARSCGCSGKARSITNAIVPIAQQPTVEIASPIIGAPSYGANQE